MSIFARALGAVGRAGNQLANKYVDENLAQQRAQFMADLQRTTAGNIREDQAAFDDKRAPIVRQRQTDDLVAQGAAQDTVALNRLRNEELNQAGRDKAAADARAGRAAKVEELTDPALQQATDANAQRVAERDARIQRDQVKATAADPEYLKSAERIALSDPKVKAQIEASRAAAASAYASANRTKAETEAIVRVNDITKEMSRVLDDPKLDDATRQKELAKLQSKLMVSGGGRKSEGGGVTEEIKETIDPKTGEVISRERNTKGPLGAAGAASAKSDPAAQLRAGVEQARADGKINDAITELRKMGATPAQILQAGVTEDELKAASQPTRGGRDGPTAAPRDPVQTMSMSDLRRIAAIDGHASQAKAKAELERRRQSEVLPDPTGLGVMP